MREAWRGSCQKCYGTTDPTDSGQDQDLGEIWAVGVASVRGRPATDKRWLTALHQHEGTSTKAPVREKQDSNGTTPAHRDPIDEHHLIHLAALSPTTSSPSPPTALPPPYQAGPAHPGCQAGFQPVSSGDSSDSSALQPDSSPVRALASRSVPSAARLTFREKEKKHSPQANHGALTTGTAEPNLLRGAVDWPAPPGVAASITTHSIVLAAPGPGSS
ncbi:hypothetical protein G7Z17_g2525 [Cylindrodendrum hubeiense]|uniref:Uncharacterized protein n=1 Tax=Cylindrodendrum hubeiense TaxID=595255 RepID=A0A9P5LBK6_9HYPO|nr:hypothetical protein G7Z17_g2525 [Cylindrodendrum hubeiense]